MTQQWQYMFLTVEPGHDATQRLNELGREGWELVYGQGSNFCLKRPVEYQEEKT